MVNFAEGPLLSSQAAPSQARGLGGGGGGGAVYGAPPHTVPQLCFNFFIVRLCLELLFQLLEEQRW